MPSPVRVDLRRVVRLRKALEADLSGAGNGLLRKVFRSWVEEYKKWLRERFVKFSQGGGDWAPLKNKYRYKRGKRVEADILVDTGTLLRATYPGSRGITERFVKTGEWEVGYGGVQVHPKAGMRIADLAEIHALGNETLPARKIVVDPPASLVRRLRDTAQLAILDEYSKAG